MGIMYRMGFLPSASRSEVQCNEIWFIQHAYDFDLVSKGNGTWILRMMSLAFV